MDLVRKRIEAELLGRSKERGGLKQRWVVIGSGSGGIERDWLSELGG